MTIETERTNRLDYTILVGDVNRYTYVDLILPDGGSIHYVRISPGTSYFDAEYEHTATPTAFYKSQVKRNPIHL